MANDSTDSGSPPIRSSRQGEARRPSTAVRGGRVSTRVFSFSPPEPLVMTPTTNSATSTPTNPNSSSAGTFSNAYIQGPSMSNLSITSSASNATQSTTPALAPSSLLANARKRSFSTTTQDAESPRPSKKPAVFNFRASIRKQTTSAPAYGDEWITVAVGPNEAPTRFSLHKELASKESAFIEAAFRHEWKESEQNVIHLPDHDPEHFRLFFLWTYNRAMFSMNQSDSQSEWNLLAGAWALGAYLQAPDFRDAVVDAIIAKAYYNSLCEQTMHEIIYPNSQTDAPIRKLLADIASYRWDPSKLRALKNDASWSDFFFDLSITMMDKQHSTDGTVTAPWQRDACAYHEHSLNGAVCYKTKYA